MSLIIKNLYVSVEGKEIVNGLNLEVKDNEVVALMGPNGSGKCIDINDKLIINNRLLSGTELLSQLKEVNSYYHDGGLVFKKEFNVYNSYGFVKRSIPYFENYNSLGYHIKTRSGREVKITPEHQLLTFLKTKEWKKSQNLSGEEFIAIPRNISFSINNKLPDPYKWTKNIKGDIIILDKNDYYLVKARLPMGWHYKDYEIKIKKNYDLELIEFFAMLTAEGHIRKYEIMITQKDYADKLFKIAKILRKMGLNARIEYHEKGYVLRISNKLFYLFLKNAFGIDEENRVPNTIFDFSENLKRFYLSWVITFDGHITKRGDGVEIIQKRKSIIDYLAYILLSFNIVSRISIKNIKNKPYYRLKI